MMILLGATGCGDQNPNASSVSTVSDANEISVEELENASADESSEKEEGLAFPYEADEGRLVVNSVFPSDLENPDCEDTYQEGVASIEFKNQSEEYLKSAAFFVTMSDGSVKTFIVEDVPAGETDWAFEQENGTVELQQGVVDISYDTNYGAYENSVMDLVSADVVDMTINLTNNSDQELVNLNVLCHADMGDALFGGRTYTYSVEYLGAGETVAIDASECLLGVKVVDVINAF